MKRLLALLALTLFPAQFAGAADSCRTCHENRQTMESLGYSHFVVTQK